MNTETMNEIIKIWYQYPYYSLGRFIHNSLYGNKLEDVTDEQLLSGMKMYVGHLKLKQESFDMDDDFNESYME